MIPGYHLKLHLLISIIYFQKDLYILTIASDFIQFNLPYFPDPVIQSEQCHEIVMRLTN